MTNLRVVPEVPPSQIQYHDCHVGGDCQLHEQVTKPTVSFAQPPTSYYHRHYLVISFAEVLFIGLVVLCVAWKRLSRK